MCPYSLMHEYSQHSYTRCALHVSFFPSTIVSLSLSLSIALPPSISLPLSPSSALSFYMYSFFCACLSDHSFSLSYSGFFGEDPPPSPGSLSWHTDTKPLAHQLLNLSILTLTHNMSTPFQLCAIVVPKLVSHSYDNDM